MAAAAGIAKTNIVPTGRPMGPSQAQADAFVATEMAHVPQVLQRPKRGGLDLANDTSNFPAEMYPNSVAIDTEMVGRAQVLGGENIRSQPAVLTYTLGPKDFEYFQSKQAAQEFSAYERWVLQQFDFKSPAEVDRFAKMFPEYFERRQAVLKNISDANLKYAQILLTGAQSADDYIFLWMCQSGRIPLIQGPIWDPAKWYQNAPGTNASLALLNPFKYWANNTQSMPTPNIPTAATGYFNVGVPRGTNQAGIADITGYEPNAANNAYVRSSGVPDNFSFGPMVGGNPYRVQFGLPP